MNKNYYQIKQFLAGRKTYLIGGLTIALGVYFQNIEMVMTGLIAMGLRAGISK